MHLSDEIITDYADVSYTAGRAALLGWGRGG